MKQKPVAHERRFFTAIGASFSHEMNNVLATINELAGLLNDMIATATPERPLRPEKVQNIVERMVKQIERGKIQSKELNKFSHSADQPGQPITAKDAVDLASSIYQRFANLKKIQLRNGIGDASLSLEGSLFHLLQLLTCCIDLLLEQLPEGSVINIEGEPSALGIFIRLSSHDKAKSPLPDLSSKMADAQELAHRLGGQIEALRSDEDVILPNLVLELPRKLLHPDQSRN